MVRLRFFSDFFVMWEKNRVVLYLLGLFLWSWIQPYKKRAPVDFLHLQDAPLLICLNAHASTGMTCSNHPKLSTLFRSFPTNWEWWFWNQFFDERLCLLQQSHKVCVPTAIISRDSSPNPAFSRKIMSGSPLPYGGFHKWGYPNSWMIYKIL